MDAQLTFGAARVWRRAATWYGGFVILYVATALYADIPWHLLDATGQAMALVNALGTGLVVIFLTAIVWLCVCRGSRLPRTT